MLNRLLRNWARKYRDSRPPDVIIGAHQDPPYMKRWWVVPRNRFLNIYLHEVGQDDDDRALHDHPWYNMSYIVSGGYMEHTIKDGGVQVRTAREAGAFKFRRATAAHRLELLHSSTVSVFITGPRIRTWGFHCPKGWVRWKEFVSDVVLPDGTIVSNQGKGCD